MEEIQLIVEAAVPETNFCHEALVLRKLQDNNTSMPSAILPFWTNQQPQRKFN